MIITIARQCGAGGLIVGQALAKHYNIPLYTRQNLQQMAQQNGTLNATEDFLNEFPVNSLLFAISVSEDTGHVTNQTRQALTNLVGNADCVLIGRCSNFIFRNRQDRVSIFLKGDPHARIQFMATYKDIPLADAQEYVMQTDESRRAYHAYYTGQTWGDAANYDLCVDSNRLGFDQTAQLITSFIDALHIPTKD